jgi:hypothetical protein
MFVFVRGYHDHQVTNYTTDCLREVPNDQLKDRARETERQKGELNREKRVKKVVKIASTTGKTSRVKNWGNKTIRMEGWRNYHGDQAFSGCLCSIVSSCLMSGFSFSSTMLAPLDDPSRSMSFSFSWISPVWRFLTWPVSSTQVSSLPPPSSKARACFSNSELWFLCTSKTRKGKEASQSSHAWVD